jgi:hypothetical protein
MLLGAASIVTVAQDDPPPAEPAPEAAGEQAPRTPADNEDDEFIPTEEIPADEEVTFPVNI